MLRFWLLGCDVGVMSPHTELLFTCIMKHAHSKVNSMSNLFLLTKNNAHNTIWAMVTKTLVDN